MDFPIFIEWLSPWLGGGAVAAAASFTVWLWLGYFRRDQDQRTRHDQIMADTQKDRDYWREMAISRQKELVIKEDEVSELRRRNGLLEAQIVILEEEKKGLLSLIEYLKTGARPGAHP